MDLIVGLYPIISFFSLFIASCCPGDLTLSSTSPYQSSRAGTFSPTSQTTTFGGKIFSVFQKGSDFLFRTNISNSANPWLIGPDLASAVAGWFFLENPQCPEHLNRAEVYAGSELGVVDVSPNDWSFSCDARKFARHPYLVLPQGCLLSAPLLYFTFLALAGTVLPLAMTHSNCIFLSFMLVSS